MYEKIIKEVIVPPGKSKEELMIERQLFFDNFDLIFENDEFIKKNKRLFYTRSRIFYVGTSLAGIKYIPAGVLTILWRQGKLTDKCPHCSGTVYIYAAGGSLLSGANVYNAHCRECRKEIRGSMSSIGIIYGPVVELLKIYPSVIVKKKLFLARESFLKGKSRNIGLTASLKMMNEIKHISEQKPLPEIIIDDSAAGCDLETLMRILKENRK